MTPGESGTPEEDPEAAEPTIVVDREAAEATVVVDREAEDRTVVVERDAAVDRTVVVERGEAADGTVAVTRERPASAPPAEELPAVPRGRRRRGMSMPPVEPGYGRGAVDAPGAGALLPHARRDAPLPAPPPVAEPDAEPATRGAAPSMPSVARLTRRAALLALATAVVAAAISVTGLVALGIAALGGG